MWAPRLIEVPYNPSRGQVGIVIETLANGAAFEVEFSDREGRTYESLGLRLNQIMVLHFELAPPDTKAEIATELSFLHKYDRTMPLPRFQNPALLQQALTHSSYANEHPSEGPDYDRLEFLGDGILEVVVRDLIFARYPHLPVGEMSQRCDRLVDEPSLAELAVKLGIPNQMRLGAGAQHERQNPSVQADMFEAVIGAYRLDAGIAAAYSYVEAIVSPLIDRALDLDPVTELQEYVQAHMGGTLPSYLEKERLGPDHAKVFILEVWAGGTSYGVGQGRSIKEARKNAAIAALRILKP